MDQHTMGLTHYWRRHQAFPHSNFQHAVKDIRLACQLTHIPLAGLDGSGSPHFSTQLVSFNGQGNLSCESFHFPRTTLNPTPRPTNPETPTHIFEFCKTNGHPYDFCVQLCLIILHHHLNVDHPGSNDTSHSPPPLQIESDRNQDYWNNAIRTTPFDLSAAISTTAKTSDSPPEVLSQNPSRKAHHPAENPVHPSNPAENPVTKAKHAK